MDNDCVVIKAKKEIIIPEGKVDNWRRIGECQFAVKKQGDGTGVGKIAFYSTKAEGIVRISGGDFYSDSLATTRLDNEMAITIGANVLFFKMSQDGIIGLHALNILQIGNSSTTPFYAPMAVDNASNSPIVVIDMNDVPLSITFLRSSYTKYVGDVNALPSKVATIGLFSETTSCDIVGVRSTPMDVAWFDMGTFAKTNFNIPIRMLPNLRSLTSTFVNDVITGDVADLPTSMTNYDYRGNGVYGDLASFPSKVHNCKIYSYEVKGDISSMPNLPVLQALIVWARSDIRYSRTSTWGAVSLTDITIENATLPTADIDRLLNDVSSKTWTGVKQIKLKGSRSSTSDNAITTLTGKGVTVTINQ